MFVDPVDPANGAVLSVDPVDPPAWAEAPAEPRAKEQPAERKADRDWNLAA